MHSVSAKFSRVVYGITYPLYMHVLVATGTCSGSSNATDMLSAPLVRGVSMYLKPDPAEPQPLGAGTDTSNPLDTTLPAAALNAIYGASACACVFAWACVCVCVCVPVRAHAQVCVCLCVRVV